MTKWGKGWAALRLCALGLLVLFVMQPVLGQPVSFVINEIQVSTTSDDWEFVEIQGTPGASLDNVFLIGIESDAGTSAGTIDRVINFTGLTIPDDGFFVAASPFGVTEYGITPDLSIVNNAFENGTASYFLVSGFTGAAGTDLDDDNAAPLDRTAWSSVLDQVAIIDNATDVLYATPALGPDGTFLPSGVYRCPDGGAWQPIFLNFNISNGTPGFTNATLCGLDVPPQVSSTIPGNGVEGVAANTNISITFNESVTTAAGWYQVVCATSGDVTAAYTNTPGSGVTQTLTYTGAGLAAGEGCTVTLNAASIVDEDGAPDPLDGNNDGTGGDNYTFAYTIAAGVSIELISAIQGTGNASPLAGDLVTVEAIVTADFQTGLGGYFLQEEDAQADADPATSEGIFVFDNRTGVDVSVGDLVRVSGQVVEFSSSGITLTELTSITSVVILSSGNSLPAYTTAMLPVAAISDWERYEGMLVTIPQQLTVTEHFQLGRFGQLTLAQGGRLRQPTQVTTPGQSAIDLYAANDRRTIVLDDASSSAWPDPVIFPAPALSAINTVRGGDTLPSLSGILDHRFGAYRIQPLAPVAFTPNNLRTIKPDAVGGTLKVTAFNVLNYFTTIDPGSNIPRGADNDFEFGRQRTKIVEALSAINADVVGLIEIENNATEAVADLVAVLNTEMGANTYAYVDTGVIGTDAIRVAMIYKPATVTPVGSYAVLTTAVDPRFIDTLNRPALAQTFEENATHGVFTVVVNHLKSKGSDCNDVGDPNTGDGQGNCNLTRRNAAAALVDWLAGDPTGSGDPDFMIIGDLNAYAMEDPIQTLVNGGYVNLIAEFVGPDAYSYVFDGEWGYLDHALANTSLAGQVAGVTEWHINADEPNALDYNDNVVDPGEPGPNFPLNLPGLYAENSYRSSDHDPVIVGLNLTPGEIEVAIDIRPLIPLNIVNLNSGGHLPVAVLSSADFDARSINVDSVTLAGAPAVSARPGWPKFTHLDVNWDGRKDTLLNFNIQDLNLDADATEAVLQGKTLTGVPITGSDSVIVIPLIRTWLLDPDDGEVVHTRRPLFRWLPRALNTCYLIQINDTPFTSDTQPVLQQATVVRATVYLPTALADGTYYWRVQVGGACNIQPGPWSEVRSFTVQR